MSATTVRDVRLRRAWPPVEAVERREDRDELLLVGGGAGLLTLPAQLTPAPRLLWVVLTALMLASFAYWLAWPIVHDSGGEN